MSGQNGQRGRFNGRGRGNERGGDNAIAIDSVVDIIKTSLVHLSHLEMRKMIYYLIHPNRIDTKISYPCGQKSRGYVRWE